jgi:hypothetical protein
VPCQINDERIVMTLTRRDPQGEQSLGGEAIEFLLVWIQRGV